MQDQGGAQEIVYQIRVNDKVSASEGKVLEFKEMANARESEAKVKDVDRAREIENKQGSDPRLVHILLTKYPVFQGFL